MARMLAVFALAVLAAPSAAAQALCPPGAVVAPSDSPFSKYKCVRQGGGGRPAERTRLPARSSLTPPTDRRAAAVETPEPRREERRNPAADCAAFNGRVNTFHRAFADRFGDRARAQDRTIERLRAAIERQRGLARDLRRQAGRRQDFNLRRHFRLQAQELEHDTAAKRAELAALEAERKAEANGVKARYAAEMRALLAQRPAQCAVELAQSK